MPDDANGNGTMLCNGVEKAFRVKDGLGMVSTSNLNIGNNVITFTYEDKIYPLRTINTTVLVEPAIKAPLSVEYGDDIEISLTLPFDAKGYLHGLYDEMRTKSSRAPRK